MLHLVTLNYLCSREELNAHLEEHKSWLMAGFKQKFVVLAGPLIDSTGGFILFNHDKKDVIAEFINKDPFIINELVSVDFRSIEPALISADFPIKLAPTASVI
ncbi:YciI family protein [Cronobacter dublinensis]|uniref:YciI family protein n=1 Tax=Cronobacter dublinensis TaxID=413497 RepID=UPI0013761E39|nr:hypothetical protein [Cronobacter dublinensis]NCH98019.1 hypothetical protein [Cronobacter dublinensis]